VLMLAAFRKPRRDVDEEELMTGCWALHTLRKADFPPRNLPKL